MRRQALGGAGRARSFADTALDARPRASTARWARCTATGDLMLETRAVARAAVRRARAEPRRSAPAFVTRLAGAIQRLHLPGGMGGGGRRPGAQPAAGADGRRRRAAVLPSASSPTASTPCSTPCYFVPRAIGKVSLRLQPPEARARSRSTSSARPTSRSTELDPALTRPGRMGRHVWFRTPTKDDRKDIFDLYLGKVDHDPDLDTDRRRDELARITNGYSPAMIEQVCSMALTYAHSDGPPAVRLERHRRGDDDDRVGHRVDHRLRARGDARGRHPRGRPRGRQPRLLPTTCLSTRLSIRKRGGSLGHHQAIEKEERFSAGAARRSASSSGRSGAMAAEHVFYGENSHRRRRRRRSRRPRARRSWSACRAWARSRSTSRRAFDDRARPQRGRGEADGALRAIGTQIMNRAQRRRRDERATRSAPSSATRARRAAAASMLGQAYVTAYGSMRA